MTWCIGYDHRFAVREIPVRKLRLANFRFSFYKICVQNHWGHKTLRSWLRTATLLVQVRLPLVRIEYVFVFQIWYCELCMQKPKKERQKALFWFLFLFFLAFFQLNISWKFELTTLPFSFLKSFKTSLPLFLTIEQNRVNRLVFLSVSTIWIVKYCTKTWHFQILIYFSLCYYLSQSVFSSGSFLTAVFICPQ